MIADVDLERGGWRERNHRPRPASPVRGSPCIVCFDVRNADQDLDVVAMKIVHPRRGVEAVVPRPEQLAREPRMSLHKNARMTVHGRLLMVWRVREAGWRVVDAATAGGVSERTAYRWLARHRAAARRRSTTEARRPPDRLARCPWRPSPRSSACAGNAGPARASRALGRPVSTVGSVLRRLWLGRLAALEAKPAAVRYERGAAGELLRLDGKKLGRIDGLGHRVIGDRAATGHAGSAGSTCTSRSTTPRALPTPSCCPTRAARPAPASSPAPPRGSPASGSSGS
jgi:leucine-zipper of insertion element IS481